MKKILPLLFLVSSCFALKLAWDFEDTDPPWFIVSATTNVAQPVAEWPVIAVTQDKFLRLTNLLSAQFFHVQASNYGKVTP
jgi:hypothetical protein